MKKRTTTYLSNMCVDLIKAQGINVSQTIENMLISSISNIQFTKLSLKKKKEERIKLNNAIKSLESKHDMLLDDINVLNKKLDSLLQKYAKTVRKLTIYETKYIEETIDDSDVHGYTVLGRFNAFKNKFKSDLDYPMFNDIIQNYDQIMDIIRSENAAQREKNADIESEADKVVGDLGVPTKEKAEK